MQSIAIIGTGISAMGAAYFLKDRFDIVFYEKNDYAGGHTNTLTVDEDGTPVYIDSAFMVYNEITYPNLTRLFKELDIKTKPTDMSFSVQHQPTGLEYCGTGLSGLFAQRKNVLSLKHWKFLLEMDRFNKEALEVLDSDQYAAYSLDDYVKEKGYSEDFFKKFLIPISSAVWSTPPDLLLKFPAVTLVRFFKNHGFLGLKGHYQWRTVENGSKQYRDKIMNFFSDKVFLNTPALEVKREKQGVVVVDHKGERKTYDKVIMASHADDTLKILSDATVQESELLSKFPYQKNRVTLHTDDAVMPRTKRAWSSWNYRIGQTTPSTIYWMNNLQGVSQKKNYFVSVNDAGDINPDKVIWDSEYAHPLFDVDGIQAQDQLQSLNENGQVYFCGAYFKYGFHEDGLTSGIKVVEALTKKAVWS